MNSILYDKYDPVSIEQYAKRLLKKSLRQYFSELGQDVKSRFEGKGRLGQFVEEEFFQYKVNSESQPDFVEAGVELKTTPMKSIAIKKSKEKKWVPKERLVLNIINYMEEGMVDVFEKSSFWKKNKLILLMFYLYEDDKEWLDFIFHIIRLWSFPENDLAIIKEDWRIIHEKILEGRAHEITEGDTRYLAACTKGSTAEKSYREQPYSDIPAKQRAYSLKPCYIKTIIEMSLSEQYSGDALSGLAADPAASYGQTQYESFFENKSYNHHKTFEDNIQEKLGTYYGRTESEIFQQLGIPTTSAKNKYAILMKKMLGITKDKIEEFEKAGIQTKTINLEASGSLKESMSFKNINYKEIINEEWEDSDWYEILSHKFLFLVFQKKEDGSGSIFRTAFFWNMPSNDLKIAKEYWEHTKQRIIEDDFSHFIKASDKKICHVRPHGKDSHDLVETATGRMEKKYSYWLNREYILGIVNSYLTRGVS